MGARALVPVAVAVLALHGCVAVDTRWDACETGAPTFVAMADCTNRTVQEDAQNTENPVLRARSQARAQRFSGIADELGEKVATGRLPEPEARVILKQVLNELRDAERDDRLTPLRPQQKTMTCSPTGPGGGVSCTAN